MGEGGVPKWNPNNIEIRVTRERLPKICEAATEVSGEGFNKEGILR